MVTQDSTPDATTEAHPLALTRLELRVHGMDCAECVQSVERALAALDGVEGVDVFLATEKAVISYDPTLVQPDAMREAVQGAGYDVPAGAVDDAANAAPAGAPGGDLARTALRTLGLVVGAVLVVVVAGEWMGLFERVTDVIPWYVGWLIVLLGWYPVLRNVVQAALRRQVISHTLMSLGVVAALAVGEWTTAAVVVFFMRVGDTVERMTTERARRAVKDLNALAPTTARVLRDGVEATIPVGEVVQGDVVVVRPGEQVPVDGDVIDGAATVNQATITGESMPVEAGPGSRVFAATIIQLGSLRVRAEAVGTASTFGQVIRLVEDAERHRADAQRLADRFSAYFLPVVGTLALLVLLIRRDPLATAAVLVVACSCAIALATPIAMLASIGAGARRGLLIKGGKYLETLAKADVLLIDKTGTVTLGQPQITDVIPLNGLTRRDVLRLAAGAERYSEHPLAEAVRHAALSPDPHRGIQGDRPVHLPDAVDFVALPGRGVRALVEGRRVVVGSHRVLTDADNGDIRADTEAQRADVAALEAAGKTLLYVTVDEQPAGILAATDTLRAEMPEAMAQVRELGIVQIELLTGDNARMAAAMAAQLNVDYQSDLLPDQKLAIVKAYQAAGKTVVMVGDGVNDAPALAQADVGIAMGSDGAAIAVEAAHIVLLRNDWLLVPQALQIARRTMGVVRGNLAWTLVYNGIGLSLAALGILPPMLAAVAQSIPDLFILGNSSRLLRQR